MSTETVKMPRAVGHVTSDASQADMDVDLPEGTPLITTDQAEAYASAVRREALEEVIASLEKEMEVARRCAAFAAVLALESQVKAIRALIPK